MALSHSPVKIRVLSAIFGKMGKGEDSMISFRASVFRPGAVSAGRTVGLSLCMALWAAEVTAQANPGNEAGSPCLEQLAAQKGTAPSQDAAPKKPNWFSRNADKILGTVGAVAGGAIGHSVCKDKNKTNCAALGAVGGALIGSHLGKLLSEADQKRYQEAAYKVALTGRPQSLSLERGCMVVEAASEETIERREFELALGPGVVPPSRLRTVAETYVHASPVKLAANTSNARSNVQVAPNVPAFVMGSTDSGKYYLLGREDSEQGYVGAGYVDAKGWVASPGATPGTLESPAGQASVVKLGVEVPCRQVSSSIRIEASNKTETVPGKVCRMPNGIPESTL